MKEMKNKEEKISVREHNEEGRIIRRGMRRRGREKEKKEDGEVTNETHPSSHRDHVIQMSLSAY